MIKYVGSTLFIMFMGLFLYMNGGKDKNKLDHVTGFISYLNKTYGNLPNRDMGKYLYLQVSGIPETMELFIGKEDGDFKPDLEKVDDLKVGEEVTVYFSDAIIQQDDGINRSVQFIDRGKEPVFIKGTWDKLMGAIIIPLGALILFALIFLKKSGKI